MSTDTSTNVTPQYTVPAGPFKGISANPGEISQKYDHESGREYLLWDTHARTRHFLDAFPPKEGWRVEVTEENLGIQLLDVFTRDSQHQPVYVDAWRFTATLRDKDGNAINNGSTIQLLNCPMALEIGETRARSKLYQALGLPASPEPGQDDIHPLNRPANAGTTAIPKLEIVAVVDEPAPADASEPESPGAVAAAADSAAPAADAPVDDAAAEESEERPSALEVGTAIHNAMEAELATTDAPEHAADSDPQLPAVSVSPAPAPAASKDASQTKADAKVNGAIPKGLLKQIEQRALRAKVPVPQLNTIDQAQAFLATLVNPTAPIMDAPAVLQ